MYDKMSSKNQEKLKKLLKKKKFDDAKNVCEEIIKNEPGSFMSLDLLGVTLAVANNHEGAIIVYSCMIETDPTLSAIWGKLSTSYISTGDENNALKSANQALELDPNNIEAWRTKGLYHQKRKEHENAIEAFDRALEIDPNDMILKIMRDQSGNEAKK